MLSSQYVQPNNKNIGDIITIYVEHVMGVETDDLTLKTGVNRQKNKLKKLIMEEFNHTWSISRP